MTRHTIPEPKTDLFHARVKSANAKQIRNESAKVLRALILSYDAKANLLPDERDWLLKATIAFHEIVEKQERQKVSGDFVPLEVVTALGLTEEQLKQITKAVVTF